MAKDLKNVFTLEKVTSGVRAEIQNMLHFANSAILNFSSVTRGHYENVNTLLASLVTWSSSRVIEGSMQGGSDFGMILQHKCLVTLALVHTYAAIIAFWHVIRLINHLFKISLTLKMSLHFFTIYGAFDKKTFCQFLK